MSALLLIASVDNANSSADAAKRGEPVEPVDLFGLEI
jgi:hypothetical protein